MLQEVWNFIKNPIYEEDEDTGTKHRLLAFSKLLVLALVLSLLIGAVIGAVEKAFDLDLGKHAIEGALEKLPLWGIVFIAVVLAPVLEEFIFRGPMYFFRNKPYFKYIFYGLTLIFGFYHVTNFEITTTILLLSPLLVAPQISVGVLLGFIRVRFGLLWAILLHAAYNLFLVGPILVLQFLDIPLQ